MIGIYKITNPIGQIYIGKSIDIESRWNQHMNLHNATYTRKLYKSFLMYGYLNHVFEVVEECEEALLSRRELYYITKYNTLTEGLNTPTGNKLIDIEDEEMTNIQSKTIEEYLESLREREWNRSTIAKRLKRL